MSEPIPPYDTGVIHGRFQVLHNDHLKYLLAGKALCQHLVVGITNPDPGMTQEEPEDPKRSQAASNPLTYYERYELVKTVLMDEGVPPAQLSIVPFPVHFPNQYHYYVPMDAVFFLTIYDGWGRKKLRYFESLKLKTHVLWEKPPEQKGIRGADVRLRMAAGRDWGHLVPPAGAALLNAWKIPDRLKTSAAI